MLRAGSCVGWLGLALVFGGWVLGEVLGGWRMGSVWGVQCLDWCLVFLKASFLVWARTKMKATAKCDQHCEFYDSVYHLKVERMLLISGNS